MENDIHRALSGNYEELEAGGFTDKWIFPMCIDDELCKKCPPAVVLTSEYDHCLQGAKETAEIYRRNDNLLVFGSNRGSHHFHYSNPLHIRSDSWHKALAKICRKYA